MIRANRVGVHPSQVDQLGYLVGGGGGTDAYTKTESDAKYVNKDQLKANNKSFYFAYDSATQKYGYKTSKTGDFIPFSSATDKFLWGLSDLTGLTFGDNINLLGGGYQEHTNGSVQTITFSFKFKVKTATTSTVFINNFPHVYGSSPKDFYICDSDGNIDVVGNNWNRLSISTASTSQSINGDFSTDKTYYVSGVYRRG